MKKQMLLLIAIVVAACSQTSKEPRDAAAVVDTAAAARIVVASGDSIPGDSQYLVLGPVRAPCMRNPDAGYATAADVIASGELQRSAYQKYGSQVDAIVGTNVLFASRSTWEPIFDYRGHFECEGTAIHFQGESSRRIATQSH